MRSNGLEIIGTTVPVPHGTKYVGPVPKKVGPVPKMVEPILIEP